MDHLISYNRSIAYTDSLIVSCGVPLYVQEALVPKMATLLVKENVSVEHSEARSVTEENTDIEEIPNEEEDDNVDCEGGAAVDER